MTMKKIIKSFLSLNPTSITTCLIMVVMAIYIIGIPILDLIELKTFDLRFKWRGVRDPSPAIVNAVIDEKSLDKIIFMMSECDLIACQLAGHVEECLSSEVCAQKTRVLFVLLAVGPRTKIALDHPVCKIVLFEKASHLICRSRPESGVYVYGSNLIIDGYSFNPFSQEPQKRQAVLST